LNLRDTGKQPVGALQDARILRVEQFALPCLLDQVTKAEELFRKTVGIGGMLVRPQDGVVFQQPVEHVERFSRRTGDGAGAEYAVLV
jgi:hypothetical protein